MAEKKPKMNKEPEQQPEQVPETAPQTGQPITLSPAEAEEFKRFMAKAEELGAQLEQQKDQYLRLLAEYDNYRKRTQKEKEQVYQDATATAVLALLPVYDNLARALRQETSDEAYAKGVQMTMNQCGQALEGLGVELIPALGEAFDPAVHNAVMHVEDENAGENTIVEVFQEGFRMGERIIRVAMVKVAN